MTDIDVETLAPEPLDDTPWEEIAENSWFCGVYRYRFDCEALIRKNDAGRFEWAYAQVHISFLKYLLTTLLKLKILI